MAEIARPFNFSIRDAFDAASSVVGIAGWEGHSWRAVEGGSIVTGCVPSGVYTRGPRKGHPKFSPAMPGTKREVVVTVAQLDAIARDYEANGGKCWDCKGSGQTWAGWSAADGTKHRTCARCNGSRVVLAVPARGGES